SIVERANLTMLAARVVYTNERAACGKKLIELFVDLARGELGRIGHFLIPARSSAKLARVWIVRIVSFFRLLIVLPASGRSDRHRNHLTLSRKHDSAFDFVFDRRKVSGELVLGWLFRVNDLLNASDHRAIRSRRPRKNFTRKRVLHR